jgi:lipoprotein-anchoring transpeptidase ErfK/SrfK
MRLRVTGALTAALLVVGIADASARTTTAARVAPPSRIGGATLAAISAGSEARSQPGGGRRLWHVGPATSWSSEPQVLLVLGSVERDGIDWVRVLLPIRPDHMSGWIPRNNVVLTTTGYWVQVDKRARSVTVFDHGRALRRYRAVIGATATPTPDGLAAIWERDRQPDPRGFLGPWALPLTLLSNVLHNFGGGPGRIAIHGRDGASLENPLGTAASHGCIRIDNGPITWMAHHLPQGTPVEITA